MIKSQPQRYLVFPIVLFVIFFLLVYIQFSHKNTISHPFGKFTISGAAPSAPGSDGVSDFVLSGAGLTISFHSSSALVIQTADKTERALRAKSYSLTENRIIMEFQYGLKLVFDLDRQGGLSAGFVLPKELEGSLKILLPFQASSVIENSTGLGLPAVEVRSGNERSFLILSGSGDRINTQRGFLELTSQAGDFYPIVFIQAPPQFLTAYDYWIGKTQDITSLLESTRQSAFQGWRFTRRRGGAGWVQDAQTAEFSSKLLTSVFAESEHLKIFPGVYSEFSPYAPGWKSQTDLIASVYIGDIFRAYTDRKTQLEGLLPGVISGTWTEWVEDPDLVRDYLIFMDKDVFDALWNKWKDRLALTVEESLARLEVLDRLVAWLPEQEIMELKRREAKFCAGFLSRTGGLVLLRNQQGLLDLELSLRFGSELMKFKDVDGQPSWNHLASVLLSTVLSRNQGGLMPNVLIPGENGWREEGGFGVEVAYVSLFSPATLPRIQKLPSLNNGFYLAKPSTNVVFEAQTIQIRTNQPLGIPQHILIQGIPEFDHVVLHGVRWRSDPAFQNYSDGWVYNPQTRTFFAKISNKQAISELVIHFTQGESDGSN